MLRLGLRLGQPIERIASETNQQFCQDLPMGRFVTAWYARAHLPSGRVDCIAAGQGPILLYRRGSDEVITLPTDLPPMGVMPNDVQPVPTSIHMEVGDVLLALTDGYFESAAPEGEQWMQSRCEALVRDMREASAADILRACNQAMLAWCQGAPAADDRTAIILKRVR